MSQEDVGTKAPEQAFHFVSYEKYTEFLDKTDYSGVDRKLINDFLKLGSVEECSPFVE